MRPLAILLGLVAGFLVTQSALARDWLVERVNGSVWSIDGDRDRTKLAPRMMVPEGRTIRTEAGSRIRLTSENNVMTLGPNTLASVVPKSFFSSKTRVLQQAGSIEFDIEKRASPHFAVDTPFMAAVVKGTKFTIDVSRKDTKIGVARGLVQVSDLRSGQTAGIGIGQKAVASLNSRGLKTSGRVAPSVSPGKPSAPSVAPLGQNLASFRAETAKVSAAEAKANAAASPSASSSFGFGAGATTAATATNASSTSGNAGKGGGSSTDQGSLSNQTSGGSQSPRSDAAGNTNSPNIGGDGGPRGGTEGAGPAGPTNAGPKGPGSRGPKGPDGGPKGPAGDPKGPGDNGGPHGPGDGGPKGPAGPDGKGPKGPGGNGAKGPGGNGAKGPGGNGPKGPAGGDGPKGPAGNAGPKGPAGSDPGNSSGPGNGNGNGNNGNGKGNSGKGSGNNGKGSGKSK